MFQLLERHVTMNSVLMRYRPTARKMIRILLRSGKDVDRSIQSPAIQ